MWLNHAHGGQVAAAPVDGGGMLAAPLSSHLTLLGASGARLDPAPPVLQSVLDRLVWCDSYGAHPNAERGRRDW
jgi:hypothetical protein